MDDKRPAAARTPETLSQGAVERLLELRHRVDADADPTTERGALAILSALAGRLSADADPPANAIRDERDYSAKKHQLLLEQIPAVTFSADLQGGLSDLYVSPQIEKLLGFTSDEWLQDPVRWYRQLHEDDKARWTQDFASVVSKAEPFQGVYRFIAKAGHVVWVRGAVNFIRDDSGRPRFLQGVGFDISEIKRGEAATQQAEQVLRDAKRDLEREVAERTEELRLQLDRLRRAEERFKLAVEASPSAMLVSDADGKILLVNRQLERLFHYEESELLGQSVDLLVPRASSEAHARLRDGYFREPTARRMGEGRDLFGRRKDGSLVPVEIGLTPIQTSEGWLAISAIMDISQHMQREEVLRDQAGRLERSNRELEEFAHVVSHDLQAPLRQISNYAQLIESCLHDERPEARSGGEKYLGRMVDSVGRMRRLINDLLLYSRVSASKDAEAVSLDAVVNDVCADLNALILSTGARVVRQALPNLMIRRLHMQQLFQNLIQNAIKYRRPGVPPVIEVTATLEEGRLFVAVADNGIGIAPEHAQRVFKLFQRLHNEESYEGTGIGLSICKKVVDLYAGQISVRPNEPAGTRFELWLQLDAH